jgi:hypothetical protein
MPYFLRVIRYRCRCVKLWLRRLLRRNGGLLSLSPELILIIVDQLEPEDAAGLASCCKRLQEVVPAVRPGLLRSLNKEQHDLLYMRLALDLGYRFHFCTVCSNVHYSYERMMRCWEEQEM